MQSALAGIVANSQDGAPIQDARVTLYVLGSGEERLEAVSGHDGSFRLTIQHSGRYMLHAAADGFQTYFIDRLLITPTQGSLQKSILMTPEVELRGRVVDQNNEPIREFSLRLSPATGQHYEEFADVSPADGYFSIKGLTPQTYILSVDQSKAHGPSTQFELLESTSVAIVLNPSDSDLPIRIRNSG